MLFSILAALALTGCSPYFFNSYRKLPDRKLSSPESYSWFSGKDRSFRYKGSLQYYSHEYSSLIVIKPLTTDSYRALMITELGIKILDIEIFSSGAYKLHYCIEQMNRKPVIKTMADCMYLMIYPVPGEGKKRVLQEKNGGRLIIRSKHRGYVYCYIAPESGKVDEIKESGYLFKKMNYRFEAGRAPELESVDISHNVIKLNIHFTRMDDERP